MPALNLTAFLLWKSGRDESAKLLYFFCLCWYQRKSDDQAEIATITENLKYIFGKEGQPVSDEAIHAIAEEIRAGRAWNYRDELIAAARSRPGSGQPVFEITDGKSSTQRTRFTEGIHPVVSTNLPVSTFTGWLKRLDPEMLNAGGKHMITDLFPMFGEQTRIICCARGSAVRGWRRAFRRGALRPCGNSGPLNKGFPVNIRRHPRYAGGDGLLPRGCYASVCKDATGNDSGTLSRECMAYVDPRVPG